jgi:hypothetical protein
MRSTAEKCADNQVTVQTHTPLILILNVPNRRESCRFRTGVFNLS